MPLLQLAAYVRLVDRTGLQLVAHACGDAAVRNFVNAVQLERSTAGAHATSTEKGKHEGLVDWQGVHLKAGKGGIGWSI